MPAKPELRTWTPEEHEALLERADAAIERSRQLCAVTRAQYREAEQRGFQTRAALFRLLSLKGQARP
jgi:hypothetical protein